MGRERRVVMETPEGFTMPCHSGRAPLFEWKLIPGDRYVVLPVSANRKRHRGRECVYKKPRRVRDDTGRGTFQYMAWVQFADNNRYGFIDPLDLIPVERAHEITGTTPSD